MSLLRTIGAASALLAAVAPAGATVQIAIDLSRQRMNVVSSSGQYSWPISSARSGFSTPAGSYAPTHLERMHYSKLYHNSPMPHSIFFRGGYAIHGTYSTGQLGRPASHGCVRLAPGNAAALYQMVQAEGGRISITGRPPASRPSTPDYARRRGSGAFYARAGARDGGEWMSPPAYPSQGWYPSPTEVYGGSPFGDGGY